MSGIRISELLSDAIPFFLKDVCTSIVGHILTFDTKTQLAQVQVGIEDFSSNGKRYTPPTLIECPVMILGGNKFLIEQEVNEGDECLIIFSQRCIDSWVETGGVTQAPINRTHSYDDAVIITGFRSKANSIKGYSNNGIKIRNSSGDKYIWLKNDGSADISVSSLNITGDVNVLGNIQANEVSGLIDVKFAGTSSLRHIHTTPSGPSGPPLPTPREYEDDNANKKA